MKDWNTFKIVSIYCMVAMFMLGILLIDTSISAKNLEHLGVVIQSLIFSSIEPRITYHLGLLLCFASFLIIAALATYEILKNVKRR